MAENVGPNPEGAVLQTLEKQLNETQKPEENEDKKRPLMDEIFNILKDPNSGFKLKTPEEIALYIAGHVGYVPTNMQEIETAIRRLPDVSEKDNRIPILPLMISSDGPLIGSDQLTERKLIQILTEFVRNMMKKMSERRSKLSDQDRAAIRDSINYARMVIGDAQLNEVINSAEIELMRTKDQLANVSAQFDNSPKDRTSLTELIRKLVQDEQRLTNMLNKYKEGAELYWAGKYATDPLSRKYVDASLPEQIRMDAEEKMRIEQEMSSQTRTLERILQALIQRQQ